MKADIVELLISQKKQFLKPKLLSYVNWDCNEMCDGNYPRDAHLLVLASGIFLGDFLQSSCSYSQHWHSLSHQLLARIFALKEQNMVMLWNAGMR